jgi:hypothetical protein
MKNRESWGRLLPRYQASRPHKMLALDGGGIRGIITLGVLQKLEELLASKSGDAKKFRLCHYFDYMAGTSTGAIIAAGLARGMSVEELTDFYVDIGPQMFERPFLLKRLNSLYTSDPLAAKLKEVYGAKTTLSPDSLETLLLVVTRNVTTDSPWPVSSNPEARYNDTSRPDCNLKIPLWQLVRASTAAPVYFPPEVLNWDPDDPARSFVFVDGGVTPYNNPAFLLFRFATQPAYRLNWETGEKKLLLVSVGTGAGATLGATSDSPNSNILSTVKDLPGALMYASLIDQDMNCRSVGRCAYGDLIDRELLDMVPRQGDDSGTLSERLKRPPVPLSEDLGRAFLYVRYNADLTDEGLINLNCGDLNADHVRQMDNGSEGNIKALRRVGTAAAEQVKLAHLGPFVP